MIIITIIEIIIKEMIIIFLTIIKEARTLVSPTFWMMQLHPTTIETIIIFWMIEIPDINNTTKEIKTGDKTSTIRTKATFSKTNPAVDLATVEAEEVTSNPEEITRTVNSTTTERTDLSTTIIIATKLQEASTITKKISAEEIADLATEVASEVEKIEVSTTTGMREEEASKRKTVTTTNPTCLTMAQALKSPTTTDPKETSRIDLKETLTETTDPREISTETKTEVSHEEVIEEVTTTEVSKTVATEAEEAAEEEVVKTDSKTRDRIWTNLICWSMAQNQLRTRLTRKTIFLVAPTNPRTMTTT